MNTENNIFVSLEEITQEAEAEKVFDFESLINDLDEKEKQLKKLNFHNNNYFYNDFRKLIYFIEMEHYCGHMKLYYSENYKVKDLMKICNYYNIDKNIRASKCKKDDIIETIIFFESCQENYEIVKRRHQMWAYLNELLNDKIMKQYVIV
jgi:hypothetical protein